MTMGGIVFRARSNAVLALTALIALSSVASLSASPTRTMGALQLDARISTKYRFGDSFCPAGVQVTVAECVRFVGQSEIPGLGRVTTTYVKILPGDDLNCIVVNHDTAVIEVAGKGTITLARPGRLCGPPAPATTPPTQFAVTGGTGKYVGAAGSLTFATSVAAISPACQCGSGSDRWTGTLTVPGLEFDTAPPTLAGAVSKTVRVPTKAKGARVRFAIAAQDLADGAVPTACVPRSGSFFSLGRTSVSCSATDSSGNTAAARLTITVKRARS